MPTPFAANRQQNPLAGHILTVDGPTASGKGTLAKTLARHWRLKFLDTGAVYRAVAWQLLNAGHNPADPAAALHAAQTLQFDFKHKGNNEFGVWVGGTEVTQAIRTLAVGQAASIVAVQPAVRAALKDFQVNFAQHWAPLVGVVLDGRDCGARIAPQASVKLFLTAAVEERARRRWLEATASGSTAPLAQVVAEVAARDARDTDNTIITPDATVIDATHLNAAQVLQAAIAAVTAKLGPIPAAPPSA